MKNKTTTFSLCCGALMTALICIMTMIVQIPIPLGYAHLGDAFILIAVAYLGKKEAIWASAIGSSMADLLTGYVQWIIPTFLIKMGIALIACWLITDQKGKFRLFGGHNALAAFLSMAWMVFGYVAAGCLLYGSFAAGLASAPGLIAEGVVNIAVYYVIAAVFERAHVREFIQVRS